MTAELITVAGTGDLDIEIEAAPDSEATMKTVSKGSKTDHPVLVNIETKKFVCNRQTMSGQRCHKEYSEKVWMINHQKKNRLHMDDDWEEDCIQSVGEHYRSIDEFYAAC